MSRDGEGKATGEVARDGGSNIGADRVAKGAKGSQIIEPLLTQL